LFSNNFDQVKQHLKSFVYLGKEFVLLVFEVSKLSSIDFLLSKKQLIYPIETKHIQSFNLELSQNSNKKTLADMIKVDYFQTVVQTLSGEIAFDVQGKKYVTKTRYTYSLEKNSLSAQYIGNHFKGLGYRVELQKFNIGSTVTQNVVATLIGNKYPNEYILIGGHFDSTSEIPYDLAPGAVDDGSGTAGLMTLATILAPYTFDRSIIFVAFGGEEQGLYGSKYYVSKIENKSQYKSVICMDMISYAATTFGVTLEGTTSFKALLDVVQLNMQECSASQLKSFQSTNSFGSDHVSFQKAGIPALLTVQRDDTNYPNYHRSTDTAQNSRPELAVEILKGVLCSVCDLAGLNSSTEK